MKRSAGQVGFDAYGEAADWKTFDGRPMPRWAELDALPHGSETHRRWECAAAAIQSMPREPVGALDFGGAIMALKAGQKVRRVGWNGKGMFLFIAKANGLSGAQFGPDEYPKIDRSICMRTAQGTICVGWLASQADMLGEDWEVVG